MMRCLSRLAAHTGMSHRFGSGPAGPKPLTQAQKDSMIALWLGAEVWLNKYKGDMRAMLDGMKAASGELDGIRGASGEAPRLLSPMWQQYAVAADRRQAWCNARAEAMPVSPWAV